MQEVDEELPPGITVVYGTIIQIWGPQRVVIQVCDSNRQIVVTVEQHHGGAVPLEKLAFAALAEVHFSGDEVVSWLAGSVPKEVSAWDLGPGRVRAYQLSGLVIGIEVPYFIIKVVGRKPIEVDFTGMNCGVDFGAISAGTPVTLTLSVRSYEPNAHETLEAAAFHISTGT